MRAGPRSAGLLLAGLLAALRPAGAAGRPVVVELFTSRSRTTRVARGGNAGRTLAQADLVRSVGEIGRWSGAALTLTAPLPAGEAAAVTVQGAGGRILGPARLGGPVAAPEEGR